MIDFHKRKNESEIDYIIRICAAKPNIGTWYDVADIINDELDRNCNESTYRKMYRAYEIGEGVPSNENTDVYVMAKATYKLRDERRKLNKHIVDKAKEENVVDQIKECIEKHIHRTGVITHTPLPSSENDLIVHLSDLHTGIDIDNFFNKYNDEILKYRLSKYASKVIDVATLHRSENCFLVLGGDMISGIIHQDLRLENGYNVIQQVMMASNYIVEFIETILPYFNEIKIVSVPGNHSRVSAKKEQNFKGEFFDSLIPFYIKCYYRGYPNISIIDGLVDESIQCFTVRDNLCIATHGDKDTPKTVADRITMMLGEKPKIIIMGHRHQNGYGSPSGVKVVEGGSCSGIDNFCIANRIKGEPEQIILVVDNDGIDCLYDVNLN